VTETHYHNINHEHDGYLDNDPGLGGFDGNGLDLGYGDDYGHYGHDYYY